MIAAAPSPSVSRVDQRMVLFGVRTRHMAPLFQLPALLFLLLDYLWRTRRWNCTRSLSGQDLYRKTSSWMRSFVSRWKISFRSVGDSSGSLSFPPPTAARGRLRLRGRVGGSSRFPLVPFPAVRKRNSEFRDLFFVGLALEQRVLNLV